MGGFVSFILHLYTTNLTCKKKKKKKEEVKTCIGLDYFTMAEQNREWG